MEESINKPVVIIGGGYAGLSAAIELVSKKQAVVLVEKEDELGGLSRTFTVDGVKFDMGPHIYFNQDKDVTRFWKELIGDKLRPYYRSNKIFYKGKYIQSPLSLIDTFIKLGPLTITRIMSDYILNRFRKTSIDNAEDWVIANFGRQLYQRFFKVYNEKIWGLPCKDITANWAGQRIKSSLFTMIYKSLKKDKQFIIKTFDFPDGGSNTIINELRKRLEESGFCAIYTGTWVNQIQLENNQVSQVELSDGQVFEPLALISTIPLGALSGLLPTTMNTNLQIEVSKLVYRNLVLVNLVFNKQDIKNFNEHWIDVHDPAVLALRVTNFSNYNFGMSDDKRSGVGIEYNCFDTDEIWTRDDNFVLDTALADLQKMELTGKRPLAFSIVRIPNAYPVYFKGYEPVMCEIDAELSKIDNLYSVGRHGMYKWNNMHHSVKTGMYAARNILGEHLNLKEVKGMVSIGKEYELNG